jgi:DNA-binding NarL/FixJ family response regulator
MNSERDTSREPWKVLLVDDDPEAHALIRLLLDLHGGFEVCAGTASARVALLLAQIHRPDAVVVDLSRPDGEGWTALPRLRRSCPSAAIVALSLLPDLVTLVEVLRMGADEYLDKQRAWRELAPVLELLCSGKKIHTDC